MKKFLFSILFIFTIGFLFSFSAQEVQAISASTSVSVSSDDAWEDADNALGGGYGTMNTTDSYTRTKLYMNVEPDEEFQAGFRWVISIPKGSTITQAYAQFYIYDASYDNIMDEIKWYFHDGTGSPPSFSSVAGNISSRSKTSNYMVWQQTNIPIGWATTPSLVLPLQEIVTAYDVSALVLFNESTTNAGSYELRVRTRDYGSNYAARLYVTYTLPPPPVVIPTVTTDIADIASVDLSNNKATLKGTVTATGGANPSQRVLEWGTSTGSYTQSYDTGAGATGTFAYTITLTPGTIYYYRAKAYNSTGWGYGAEKRVVIYLAPGGQKVIPAAAATTTLTLNKNIAPGGTVISSTGSISCGTACLTQTSTPIASGTSVVLTPTAASGYTFSSWTGCTSVTGNNCNVTMNVNKTVTATFAAAIATTTLTLNKNIAAAGTVISSTGSISCGTACLTQTSTPIASGTSVVLTPTAASGYTFSSWTGCTSVTGNNCNVTMNVNKTVTATFNRPPDQPIPQGVSWTHCWDEELELSIPMVNWTYSDPDGDPQSAYEIKIYGLSTLDATITCPTSPCLSYAPTQGWVGNNLNWGVTYNWQVRVKDDKNNWSLWSNNGSFTMPSHAHPWVDFSWSPSPPIINNEVQFTDRSKAYGGATTSGWNWSFDFGNPPSSSLRNPTTTFSVIETGGNGVSLQACDNTLPAQGGPYCCPGSKTITVSSSLPEWIEVPPF